MTGNAIMHFICYYLAELDTFSYHSSSYHQPVIVNKQPKLLEHGHVCTCRVSVQVNVL